MYDNPFQSPASSEFQPPNPAWGVPWGKIALGLGILAVLVFLILPFGRVGRGTRSAALRNSCRNSLKHIGLALQNYYDKHGSFPPAYTVDAAGKPLHSWRTLLLPYLEEEALYKTIDLTKPWDDPVNAKALNTVVSAFQCPANTYDSESNLTTYQAVVTPESCLRGGMSATMAEIKDGPDKTVVVVEVPESKAVPWMKPSDVDEAFFVGQSDDLAPGDYWPHAHLLFADNHIEHFNTDKTPAERRALITIAGGEK